MKQAIATVSLSGSLDDKLEAIAAAGFSAVEIFENDFLGCPLSARAVRQRCGELGLDIICYQPFRDFEGLPEPERAQTFDRIERKFDVMAELGTDLMLICSSVHPAAIGGIDRAAADFRALGERAARRGLKVGFEALAWGRHISDYRDAWEVVRRANHPNIGLILDSFHIFARGTTLDPIQTIPGDRIFLVQLADAPQLHLDALSWSRHFRCFPGQGDLPVVDFCDVVARTGYDGAWSLEIFNDQFRAASAKRIAVDGKRALDLLTDQLAARSTSLPANPARLPPKPACRGVEFVEFASAPTEAERLREAFTGLGFHLSGRHRHKSVEWWSQAGINLVINTDPKGFAHAHALMHGMGVCAIGLRVDDVATALTRAETLGAQRFAPAAAPGDVVLPAIRGVGGSLIYFVDDKGPLADLWHTEFTAVSAADIGTAPLQRVDHVAQSLQYEEMLSWLLFYRAILDLERTPQIDIVDPGGLIQSQALVSGDASLRLALNGSLAHRTQSNRFVDQFAGAGVQHIAFETGDIFATAAAMRRNGVATIEISGNYYDDLAARYQLAPDEIDRLRAEHILFERQGAGEFYQVYTQPIAGRFFFEIVERRDYGGFGASNSAVRLAAQARDFDKSSLAAL